ncbi:MAG: hypothetical protein HKN87_20070 [Saprospiraceae bacterium]|nr:hypothetical protein [Saprospiraceae bacterium]
MKEFMLFIRNEGNPVSELSPEEQQNHVQKVGSFIKQMISAGKMKAAQPLKMEGAIVSFENGAFMDGPFNETKEVISGYYHILAESFAEAVEIAKSDPRFEDGKWRIEVRPVMKVEGING